MIDAWAGMRLFAPALMLLAMACSSNHRVSPWPDERGLAALIRAANDIEQHVALARSEMKQQQMAETRELRGTFVDGAEFVLLSFEGSDSLGNARHAVRAATRQGIIMALGPPEGLGRGLHVRSRLVEALLEGGGWKSGTDLNGDKLPDVVVAAESDDSLEIWSLYPSGSAPHPMHSQALITHAMDIDADGLPDPAGRVRLMADDAIEPYIEEVLTFSAGEYRSDTQTVRAYHQQRLDELDGRAKPGVRHESKDPALALALERCWHRVRAGHDADDALGELDKVASRRGAMAVPVRDAWLRWRFWMFSLGRDL